MPPPGHVGNNRFAHENPHDGANSDFSPRAARGKSAPVCAILWRDLAICFAVAPCELLRGAKSIGAWVRIASMTDQISWCVELAVKPGCLDTFKELTAEMVASTRNESGVLSYQRFVTNDEKMVHAYEQYADSDSALAHLQKFRKKFSPRFSSMVDRMKFTVYGTPSAELKRLLDGFGAVYLGRFGDLEYWP
jgi:quinol monooxygenase YgiN